MYPDIVRCLKSWIIVPACNNLTTGAEVCHDWKTEKCTPSSKTMSYLRRRQHTPYISVIQRSIDELLFKINTTKPVSSEHIFKQTWQLQRVHLIMSPAMAALFHWNPASAQRVVRFPLQFNLPYYTNSLKAQLNPWQMQAAYVIELSCSGSL
jgi:hypothetical protein